jgi:hypothetical protein
VRHHDDYDAAVATFRWPDMGDRFNWALDWFDPIAAGNPRTALRTVMPATTALGPKDLADRVGRGAVRHVIANADEVDKFASMPGDFGRIAIGDAPLRGAVPARRRRGHAVTAHHPDPRG